MGTLIPNINTDNDISIVELDLTDGKSLKQVHMIMAEMTDYLLDNRPKNSCYPAPNYKQFSDFKKYIANFKPVLLVAKTNNSIIGFISLELKNVNEGYLKGDINFLAVSSDYKSKGIGRALLMNGLDYLSKHNCSCVSIRVSEWNKKVVRLYESVGFKTRHFQMSMAL